MDRNYFSICISVLVPCLIGHVCGDRLSLPCSSPTALCGRATVEPVSRRVVGGQESQVGAWPWTVSLSELGTHTCGGGIINERLILTASHCFMGDSNDPSRWLVAAGKHDLSRTEAGQQVRQVKKIILHEEFDNITIANDIALLELTQPLNFTVLIQSICLPTWDQPVEVGDLCLLAGWGNTMGMGNPNVLNQVLLPIISDDTCSQDDWYGTFFIKNITFCAGYAAGGKDACKGDSGSPLICKRGDKWYAQGIASWGFLCAESHWPGTYTAVNMYTDWIQQKAAESSLCGNELIG